MHPRSIVLQVQVTISDSNGQATLYRGLFAVAMSSSSSISEHGGRRPKGALLYTGKPNALRLWYQVTCTLATPFNYTLMLQGIFIYTFFEFINISPLLTGPDGIGDHRVAVKEDPSFVGHRIMSTEATSDTSYLYRAPKVRRIICDY